eukprot:scaffold1253_cov85-Isochrysis_galbana.AAC.2
MPGASSTLMAAARPRDPVNRNGVGGASAEAGSAAAAAVAARSSRCCAARSAEQKVKREGAVEGAGEHNQGVATAAQTPALARTGGLSAEPPGTGLFLPVRGGCLARHGVSSCPGVPTPAARLAAAAPTGRGTAPCASARGRSRARRAPGCDRPSGTCRGSARSWTRMAPAPRAAGSAVGQPAPTATPSRSAAARPRWPGGPPRSRSRRPACQNRAPGSPPAPPRARPASMPRRAARPTAGRAGLACEELSAVGPPKRVDSLDAGPAGERRAPQQRRHRLVEPLARPRALCSNRQQCR